MLLGGPMPPMRFRSQVAVGDLFGLDLYVPDALAGESFKRPARTTRQRFVAGLGDNGRGLT